MRGIWDWGVCSLICNIRAAFGNAGCCPKCEFSRRSEEMERLADHGNEGNPVFGPYAAAADWRKGTGLWLPSSGTNMMSSFDFSPEAV